MLYRNDKGTIRKRIIDALPVLELGILQFVKRSEINWKENGVIESSEQRK
jgi:hypothetical protein